MSPHHLSGKSFVASYSGGKDSTLALFKAINLGLRPLELLMTYRSDNHASWFHGISPSVIDKLSDSLALPIRLINTSADLYEANFAYALSTAKANGAEVCVFGDIDIDGHLQWCSNLCESVGIIPFFPLWHLSRKSVVDDLISAGFKPLITIVNSNFLPVDFLGKILDHDTAALIEASGADICGENGEYHTLTFDGPIFSKKIFLSILGPSHFDNYSFLRIS